MIFCNSFSEQTEQSDDNAFLFCRKALVSLSEREMLEHNGLACLFLQRRQRAVPALLIPALFRCPFPLQSMPYLQRPPFLLYPVSVHRNQLNEIKMRANAGTTVKACRHDDDAVSKSAPQLSMILLLRSRSKGFCGGRACFRRLEELESVNDAAGHSLEN